MNALNILLAVGAAVMIGVLVNQKVEGDWAGPVAGVVVLVALIGFERARKGRRDAR
jgi:hypothetical protein